MDCSHFLYYYNGVRILLEHILLRLIEADTVKISFVGHMKDLLTFEDYSIRRLSVYSSIMCEESVWVRVKDDSGWLKTLLSLSYSRIF